MKKTTASYRWLADHYDDFFRFGRPFGDAARECVLGRILPNVQSACDLCCGTGTTALQLVRNGIRMYGVDISPSMCRIARKKARLAHLQLRVLRADMRDFRLPEPVDLVLCEFDAINHLPLKGELPQVARAVSSALRPGGYFYFDVNNRRAFEIYWKGTYWIELPGVALVSNNGHARGQDKAWASLEIFIREGRCWRRRQERIEEVCWTATEIRSTLREAGFDRIRAWDATPFFKGDSTMRPGCRTFYLARKAPGQEV